MKKIFTLALVMAMAMTSFAQVKSSKVIKNMKAEKIQTYTGLENIEANYVASTRSIMTAPEEEELSQSFYDWQSNSGARNFTAVWPDGFAVMCYTQATSTTFSDRGTGLAIWDPAVGSWEFTDTRVEGVKTGFGSIARYGENGLVVAAHCASDARIFIVEDFRQGNRNFGEGITLPVTTGVDPVWPVVQCSGENLDYVNVLITNSDAEISGSEGKDPIIYYQYHNGEWLHQYEMIPNLDADHLSDGGSNICYFMLNDEARPNRVAFILNNAWSDCKAVISEDNGTTWTERVFWQHPGIHEQYTTESVAFLYPRWTNAEFDADDNLHVVYEYNGTNDKAGSNGYYPTMGGIGYWSEVLPKNEMCLGGIGNVGEPFIMDSTYMMQDLYESEWYWSDANHDPLPEYIGEIEPINQVGAVVPRDDASGLWLETDLWGLHGSYNGGKAEFATMHMDGDRIWAFWSMLCGNATVFVDANSADGNKYLRLFGNMSTDGGNTWLGTQALTTEIMYMFDEMTYCQVIPYVYSDANGDYVWVCYQCDGQTGTYVQGDEDDPSDNLYRAIKVYQSLFSVDETVMPVVTTMNVYPNPAEGSFMVQLDNAANISIYNTVGQLVKTYENVKEVRVNNLEAGIYFVNAGNQTTKVVVK